jgi:hypothetical protein
VITHRILSQVGMMTIGMVYAYMDQKVMPINLIVRQNQPLKLKKSAQKAQMM